MVAAVAGSPFMLRTLSLADVDGEGGRAWASGHGLLLRGTSWACRGWCRARRLWAAWCKAGEISPFPPVYHRPTHQRSFSTPMAQASRTFLLTMPRGNGCSCAPPQTGSYPSAHAFLLCSNGAVESVAFVPLLPKLCLPSFGLASAGFGHGAALGQARS